MVNPNNCANCDYKKLNASREKGHCYMFKDSPTDVCMQHTARQAWENLHIDMLRAAAEIGKAME